METDAVRFAEFAVAGILLVLDLFLTCALLSGGALDPVSLHLLESELPDAEPLSRDLHSPFSRLRTAAYLVRQMSLLGFAALVGLIGWEMKWPVPRILIVLAAGVFAVLLLELTVARWIVARRPRTALRRLLPLMRVAGILTSPVLFPVQRLLNRIRNGETSLDETRDETPDEAVEAYFEVGEREGILEAEEGRMMRSIVDLGETRVREIMTPRTEIEALPLHATVGEARHALLSASHSGLPVYKEALDGIVGVLYTRDLIRAWEEGSESDPLTDYLRPAYFVPESQMADDLLEKLRTRSNMALVVDEYGGIAGLVTMEDLLEEIVGDIRDEHDAEEETIRRLDEKTWRVNGLVHIGEIEELFGLQIGERDFDTVGGLVVARLGMVPEAGKSFLYQGLEFTVTRSDPRRVYDVRIRIHSRPEQDGTEMP